MHDFHKLFFAAGQMHHLEIFNVRVQGCTVRKLPGKKRTSPEVLRKVLVGRELAFRPFLLGIRH